MKQACAEETLKCQGENLQPACIKSEALMCPLKPLWPGKGVVNLDNEGTLGNFDNDDLDLG